ncbi:restriction endonuclease subunit S [Streptomyces sp. NPDC005776]|uniref:restriction endonuclease subunit S n=1 Tax=Streptomyces sp. NPDC005776 TaxID=3154676 RepID=UPI0033CDD3F3
MELPAGWAWVSLEEVAEVTGGIQKQQKRRPVKNVFPFLRVANVGRGSLDLSAVHEVELFDGEIDRFRLQFGDLLVVEGNGSPDQIGRAATWQDEIKDAVHQNHLIRVRPWDALSSNYLELMWNSRLVADQLMRVAQSTSGLYTLSTSKLKRVELPLPPLAEQHRIVEALEGHLSRLDAAASSVSLCELRIPKLEGAIRGRFTGSLSASDALPGNWRWGSLGDVLERVEAGRSFRCEPRPAADQEWGVIKVSAMTWGEFRECEQKAVPAGKNFDIRHEIREGDILVSRANTADYVGAPVIVKKTRPRLLLSDKSLRLVPASGVSKAWLATVLASPYVRQQISARATGTKDSMRNISQGELAAIRIPIPPMAEQDGIADQVDSHLLASSRFSAEMRQAMTRSKNLRTSLLNRAFTGALVPQDPTDEPAAALLARIQADRAAQPKAKRARRTATAPRKPEAAAAPAPAPAPSPTPTHAVQQEFDL